MELLVQYPEKTIAEMLDVQKNRIMLNDHYYLKHSFSFITVNKSSLREHQDPLFLSTRLLSITNIGCIHMSF